MEKKALLIVVFLIASSHYYRTWTQVQKEFLNEGVLYPQRSHYFSCIPKEYFSKVSFQNLKNLQNPIVFNCRFTNLSDCMLRVSGVGESIDTDYPSAVIIKGSENGGAATLLNDHINDVTEKGFTIAFWTKWPYSSSNLTSRVLTIKNERSEDIYEMGITHDRRVYVKRQVYKSGSIGTVAPYWNLKFWNPENTDIEKAVTKYKNGLEWFFIMIVQEKTQVRLHVGMPDGTFDCMYLNYGLQDQVDFKRAQEKKYAFFGNDEDLYLQDLSLWNNPLCRQEAFEYYKDARGDVEGTIRHFNNILDTSKIKTIVKDDDSKRMIRDAGRSEGCLRLPLNDGEERQGTKRFRREIVLHNNKGLDVEAQERLVVYPVPASTTINIKLPLHWIHNRDQSLAVDIGLYNLYGRVLQSTHATIPAGKKEINWSFDNVKLTGIYVLKVSSLNQIYSVRIAIDCGCK